MAEGADEHHRVRALLECWADWRGTVRRVLLAHMQPHCSLGVLVRTARQSGELYEHNEVHEPELPDELMAQVDRIVCALPRQQLEAVRITYIEGRYWTAGRRAKKLDISRREYYYRLKGAHETVAAEIDWRNVLVA